MTSDALLDVIFIVGATLSLVCSWLLIVRIERVGARLGLSEGLLGMAAALAGDAPEITAAVAALTKNDTHIGAGVVIGSNVFNIATLLGLSAVVAGRVALHRRVIEMNGAVATWIAVACLAVMLGWVAPEVGLLLAMAVLVPYLAILGMDHERIARMRLPRRSAPWIAEAVREEDLELERAIRPGRGRPRDALIAALATLVVISASIAMERAASRLGARHGVPGIVTGGLVLAAVTSLPNAVAGVYLARRGRGAAVLSTALNSNALNVVAGLLIPGAIIGLGAPSGQTTFVAASYLGITLLALFFAHTNHELRRSQGAIVIAAYALFVALLLSAG